MKVEVKITGHEDELYVLQPFHQQCGEVLEVEDDVASRWDYITKQYIRMQEEIEEELEKQNPPHQHFE